MAYAHASDPLLSPQLQREERRVEPRHLAVRWLARLVIGDRQELCVVRDIWADGLVAETFTPIAIDQRIQIDLKGDRHRCRVVRADDTHVELRFDEPIDVEAAASAQAEQSPGTGPAAPHMDSARMDIACEASLDIGEESHVVDVRDLSQRGARVATVLTLPVAMPVTLTITGLEPIRGTVRWCEAGAVGISFLRPIRFEALSDWTVTRESEAESQPRRWPRYSILLKTSARIGNAADEVPMLVHNISRGGVLVTCSRGLTSGEEVVLGLGPAGMVRGKVVWIDGDHAGIGFSRTIDGEHVLHPLGDRSVAPLLQHRADCRRPAIKPH